MDGPGARVLRALSTSHPGPGRRETHGSGLPDVRQEWPAGVAASLAHAARLPELVVGDLGESEALAVALAAEPDRLRALTRHLIAGLGTLPVFDVAGRARALEEVYAAMVDRRRRGLPPGAIGAATRA